MEPKEKYPTNNTTKESRNCFLSFTNQYKQNKALQQTKNATPRLRTDNTEKLLGGVNGKIYDNNKRIAKTAFIK